jgi:hypothetical protein
MGDRDTALARLTAWHAAQPWARIDPRHVDIAEVVAVGPLELVLRTEHEVRGVEYQLVPAARRDLAPPQAPDPWAHTIDLAPDAPIGASARAAWDGHPIPLDCTNCSGSGELKCERCDGTGRITAGRRSYPCPTCSGRAVLRCDPCRGSGGVVGMPTLWARIDVTEARRTTDNAALPTEVTLDLADRPVPGEVVWRREGPSLDAAVLEGAIDASAVSLAKELLADPGTPARSRVRKQTLEVRRMAVYEVRRISGATFHVWGEPPSVHPKLVSTLGRMLPFLAR